MTLDPQAIERIVELVTQQVLAELKHTALSPAPAVTPAAAPAPRNEKCHEECGSGYCVRDCGDKVELIVEAGAARVSAELGAPPTAPTVGGMIDHTLLKPEATPDQIAQLCYEARKYGFAAVCVNPTHVKLSAQLLRGSNVAVCTVVGFPLGATPPEVKAYEAQLAIEQGATEIDMVVNIGALKARDLEMVARDIRAVVRGCHAHQPPVLVKVIIEAALLTDEEKIAACLIAKECEADYVKTSTGFAAGGATVADVTLMRRTVGPEMGVKAAGGVRTRAEAEAMIAAGATRIGASAGIKIAQTNTPEAAPATPAGSKY
jgi:deoxyribose-phosphate aldolase